jgi:anti-sigma-K factor RskA
MSPEKERLEELAALCAAGAASASEQAELESLAARDPEVRALVRGYADAASLLALDLAPLPAPAGALDAVRRRVVSGAGGAGGGTAGFPPVGRLPGTGGEVIPLSSRRRTPIIAAALVPLAAAAAFAFFWWQERGKGVEHVQREAELQKEIENERRVRTRAEEEAARLRRDLGVLHGTLQRVSTPELQLATVKSDQGVVVKILLDPLTGSWYVLAFRLDPAAADQDYQLWFLDKKGGPPVPSEVFRPGPSGSLHALIRVPAGVDPGGAAISLEPKGGSPTGSPTRVVMDGPLL